MSRSIAQSPLLFCVAATISCADVQQPSAPPAAQATVPADPAVLAAHTPAHSAPGVSVSPQVVLPYRELDGAAATASAGSVHLQVDASGSIPRHPDAFIHSVAVFGYAWADLATGRGIVAVIHPAIGRDSRQNPTGWHTHPVLLAAGTTGTGGTSNFCVASLGSSQGGLAIVGDVLRVSMADHWATVSVDEIDVAASFVVQGDAGCAASGLGVRILDTALL